MSLQTYKTSDSRARKETVSSSLLDVARKTSVELIPCSCIGSDESLTIVETTLSSLDCDFSKYHLIKVCTIRYICSVVLKVLVNLHLQVFIYHNFV